MRAANLYFRSVPVFFLTTFLATRADAGEEVVFFTADHVEIRGTYYPVEKGPRAPCVLLLHALQGSRKDAGWESLAEHLQKKRFAVLAFDFRGHGQSKTVGPEYWQTPTSRSLKANANGSTSAVHLDQFVRPAHWAALVNDIRAARRVLELKSRDGQCDASKILVVGADTGASLGLLWIDAEWQRSRMAKDAGGRPIKQGAEALDIAGAVWLSFNSHWPTSSGQTRFTAPLESWMTASTGERIPMGFLHGDDHSRSKSQSMGAFDKLSKSTKDVHRLSTSMGIDSSRIGSGLIEDDGRAAEMIATYFGNVLADRPRPVRTPPDLETLPPVFNPETYGIR